MQQGGFYGDGFASQQAGMGAGFGYGATAGAFGDGTQFMGAQAGQVNPAVLSQVARPGFASTNPQQVAQQNRQSQMNQAARAGAYGDGMSMMAQQGGFAPVSQAFYGDGVTSQQAGMAGAFAAQAAQGVNPAVLSQVARPGFAATNNQQVAQQNYQSQSRGGNAGNQSRGGQGGAFGYGAPMDGTMMQAGQGMAGMAGQGLNPAVLGQVARPGFASTNSMQVAQQNQQSQMNQTARAGYYGDGYGAASVGAGQYPQSPVQNHG